VVVDVSRRPRSPRKLLGSALRLVAIYAGVRAALRAEAVHIDKTGRIQRSAGRPKREADEHLKSGPVERESPKALTGPSTSALRKVRTPAGEARSSGHLSTTDSSTSTRRHRSHEGASGRTYRQLYEEARRRGVRGRSAMSKAALEEVLSRPKTSASGRP
jgi:hypothetical protein